MQKSFLVIYLAVFVTVMAFTIAFPLLPSFAKTFQASDATIGILAASFAATQFFFSPFLGTLSDRFGRKPLIVGGLLGMAISFVGFGLSTSLGFLFFFRALQGIFAAAVFPATHAFIADVTRSDQRVTAMGRLNAAVALGIIAGPIIGGVLATTSLALPFLAAAFLGFVNTVLVIIFLPESLAKKAKEKIAVPTGLPQLMHIWQGLQSTLAPLFLLAFAWSFGISNNQVAVPLLGIEQFNLQADHIGAIFSVLGIVWAITQFFLLTRITLFFGEHRTVFVGISIMALAFFLFPFLGHNILLLYATAALAGFGSAISRPVIIALMSQETNQGQGATMGVASSFESLGRFLAPLMGGMLFGLAPALPFLVSSVISLLVLFFVLSKTHFLKPGHTL